MGIYLNPDNMDFQMALNSEIYVDKSELIKQTNAHIFTEQRFICVSRPKIKTSKNENETQKT